MEGEKKGEDFFEVRWVEGSRILCVGLRYFSPFVNQAWNWKES